MGECAASVSTVTVNGLAAVKLVAIVFTRRPRFLAVAKKDDDPNEGGDGVLSAEDVADKAVAEEALQRGDTGSDSVSCWHSTPFSLHSPEKDANSCCEGTQLAPEGGEAQ